tara:strand:+ start:39883 stop:40428 length:546 start_codon:yes stop_codon:yes gene_type:complete
MNGHQDLKGRPMKLTKFTAGLLALSIGTAGLAAVPARASDQDVAMALGGLLTLFVIGKAIENKGDHNVVVDTAHDKPDAWRDRNRGDAFLIPNECVLTVVSSRDGHQYKYGHENRTRLVALERCVDQNRKARAPLPRACETRVSTKRGRVDAYDVGCLTNFGFRVARSRGDYDHGKGHGYK